MIRCDGEDEGTDLFPLVGYRRRRLSKCDGKFFVRFGMAKPISRLS